MSLENMKEMLTRAKAGKYAVGAFNILDYNSMLAVVRAAEEERAPVILQTSAKTVEFWGARPIVAWARAIAEHSPFPVALHLDHCRKLDLIRTCVDAGWTSVMIDASNKPLEENMAITAEVVAMAAPAKVSVEAELGEIGGVEDELAVADAEAHLADPRKAERFCGNVGVDCFAPAIGTAHGIYKGEPKIAFDRLKSIAESVTVPLALHGGTGLTEEVFKKCIAYGCAKVNISTQIKHAFINAFVQYHQQNRDEYNPLNVLAAQFNRMKQETRDNIKIFGSSGKA